MIEQIDFFTRIVAIGASLMLLAQLVEGNINKPIKIAVIGLIIGAIAYLINASPALRPAGRAQPWVELIAVFPPFWSWLFARRLFEREPDHRFIWGAVAALVLSWFMANFLPFTQPISYYLVPVISLVLIGDLMRVAFSDRADDLIEKRRTIRLWLPLLVGAQAAAILIHDILFGIGPPQYVFLLLGGALIFLLVVFAGLALLTVDPELLAQDEGENAETEKPALQLSPAEAVLHEKLVAAMGDSAWREPGLTIASLSERLDVPEHRLRALINRRLGYRNFSAFLNRHRIAEARLALVDKAKVDLPVLTIAMDLGYNSLATFNRAFRSETGTTPSDFRRLGMADEAVSAPDQN
ncbi:MAG: helix-turn-helix domain-containing protein [Pseudomonadota bacterium]